MAVGKSNRHQQVKPGYENRAWLLVRVSTDPQEKKNHSIPKQLKLIRKDLDHWQLVEANALEETYSAAAEYRPKIEELKDAIEQGIVGAVVVAYADRFSRDMINAAALFGFIRDHGVRLISIREHIDFNDPIGKLQWADLIKYAEMEHNNIFRRTSDTKLQMAIDGQLPTAAGGRVYGYSYNKATKKWSLNKREAVIVRKIFRWSDAGESAYAIIKRLSGRYPKPEGGMGLWSRGTIHRIRRRRAYTGVWVAYTRPARPETVNRFTHTEWAEYHLSGAAPIEIRGVFQPIITVEQFERVQLQMSHNKQWSLRNNTSESLLRSRLYCGRCGRAMYNRNNQRNPDGTWKYRYYRCTAKAGTNHVVERCECDDIRMEDADAAVWEEFVSYLEREFDVERARELRSQSDDYKRAQRAITDLERVLAENREENRQLRARLDDRQRDRYEIEDDEEKLAENRKQRAQIDARLEVARQYTSRNVMTDDDIAEVRTLTASVRDQAAGATFYEKKRLLALLRVTVTWYDGEGKLVLKVLDGADTVIAPSRSPDHNVHAAIDRLTRFDFRTTLFLARPRRISPDGGQGCDDSNTSPRPPKAA